MPVAAILSGGLSIAAAAAVNGGITLDDELNANRIAETCAMHQYQKQQWHPHDNGHQLSSKCDNWLR